MKRPKVGVFLKRLGPAGDEPFMRVVVKPPEEYSVQELVTKLARRVLVEL